MSSPTGGDKDVDPPRLLKRTPADSMLQVKHGQWTFQFDEFIKLQEVQKEVRVTPMLKNNPKITANKNRLTLEIADSLIVANTTYRIDFGKAVRDIHEGNPITNLQLTFSSGTYFDSLSWSGICMQAQNGYPDTGVVVMLYPAETPDSLLFKTKPMYVEKNARDGFRFQHLPNRLFKAVALQDPNANLLRDALSDRLAFYNNLVNPAQDTQGVVLWTFAEGEDVKPGKTGLQSSARGKMKAVEPLNYKVFVDTAQLTQRTFNRYDSVKVVFNRKPTVLQASGIRLYSDSMLEAEAQWREGLDSLTYFLVHQWQENTVYRLVFSKAFAADTQQQFLPERAYTFRTKQANDYGLIRLLGVPNAKQIIQLVSNDSVIMSKPMNDSVIVFEHLLPGEYSLRQLKDANGNGMWDKGSLPDKRQPEQVELLFDRVVIKGNWENVLDTRTKKD